MFIGVTGHQDIPESARAYITDSINEIMGKYSKGVTGVSSLAAGADQIFAEILYQRHELLYVVVPSKDYESAFDNDQARDCYKRLLESAALVETCPFSSPTEEAFFAAGKRVVDLSDHLIAIWDGKEAKGEGGTADIVDYARERAKAITVVWPKGLSRK
jgi:hypothetical protein